MDMTELEGAQIENGDTRTPECTSVETSEHAQPDLLGQQTLLEVSEKLEAGLKLHVSKI